MTVITRFAPSPTGLLHIGNIRTALVNWLFAKSKQGQFMLRIDDTDTARSKKEYEEAIKEDLSWIGISWDIYARQSDRLDRYEEVKQLLLKEGRLYPCYETAAELEMKRKMQLNRGLAPIYDRAALKLTAEQKQKLEAEGRRPHFRFLLSDEQINWHDQVKGELSFDSKHLSDPILIREDASMTYILSSVVDDIDFAISHIIRGEDHVTNTAIQIQIFKSLASKAIPEFAHLALIAPKDAKISKREGGFDIRGLHESGIDAMAICSLLAKLGTSDPIEPRLTLQELVAEFSIAKFGKARTGYDQDDLERLNHKLIAMTPFTLAQEKLQQLGLDDIGEAFWLSLRGNLDKVNDIKDWWNICKLPVTPVIEDQELISIALSSLPDGELGEHSWSAWISAIQQKTSQKGKALFMPIRKALTAREDGPELKYLLPFIGRDKVIKRLSGETA